MAAVVNQKKIHNTIFQIAIWATIISMALSAILLKVFSRTSDGSIATVNGVVIEEKDFRRRIEATQRRLMMLRMQFEQAGMPYDPAVFERNPVAHAIQSLVDDALVDEVAQSLNIHLDEQFIMNKLMDPYFLTAELPEFIPPYVLAMAPEISKQTIERMLAHEHVRISDFEQYVEHSLARRMVRDIVSNAIYVPPFAIHQAYIQQFAPKTFEILTLPFAHALAHVKEKPANEEDVRKFYEQDRKKYTVPEKRSATVWEFNPAQYGIEISDADIQKYYDQHKNKYVQEPVKVKVRRIVFGIGSQADAPIAHTQAQATRAEVMQDPTRGKWQDMPFFARGEKDPAFEQVAFSLKEDGAISAVVQTKDGFEILQRVERKPASYKPLSAVKKEVEQTLRLQQFHKEFAKGVSKETAAQFAQQKHGSQSKLEQVTKEEKPLHAKLFGLKSVGDIGIVHEEGKGYILQVAEIRPSYVPALKDIRDKVAEDFYKQKARGELRRMVNEIAAKAKKMPLADLAKEYQGQLRTIGKLKGDETDRITQLTKEQVPVVQMLHMEKAGQVTSIVEADGYVAKLVNIEPFTEDQVAAKKNELNATISRDWTGVMYQGFIASLARSATISINEKALAQQ